MHEALCHTMTDDIDYDEWLAEGGRIRVGVRAIVFNRTRDKTLVEKSRLAREPFANFLGGGLQLGETFEQCLQRELSEETDGTIARAEYLFVVENMMYFQGQLRHGIGHYFEVELEREEIRCRDPNVECEWIPIHALQDIDLRPHVVRDRIIDGTYRDVCHVVSRDYADAAPDSDAEG